MNDLTAEEIERYQNNIIKIPDDVYVDKINTLTEEINNLRNKLTASIQSSSSSTLNKTSKSILYEYIQKHKLTPMVFHHNFNDYSGLFNSMAYFNNKSFKGTGLSKKAAETNISSNILDYINNEYSIMKYTPPKTYDKIILIDLENFTNIPMEILPNYSAYKILGYLAYNHALVDKLDYIERFMNIKLVNCLDKDAVDIMMTIDIARYENDYKEGKIKKIFLLTGDHFGKTVATLTEYCQCINDHKYLLNHRNSLLE